jgi:hypothetical protein
VGEFSDMVESVMYCTLSDRLMMGARAVGACQCGSLGLTATLPRYAIDTPTAKVR